MRTDSHNSLRLTVAAVALAVSPAALATSYSDLIIFGDSLSDVGNISFITGGFPPPPYAPGRFTSNFSNGDEGRVYAEYIGDSLGIPVTASLTGGNNYAFGGALIGPANTGLPPSLIDQVNLLYLGGTGDVADPDALYVLFGGGNDVLGGDVTGSAAEMASLVTQLAAAGAQNFFIPNLPDIGATPQADIDGDQIDKSKLTDQYNEELAEEIANLEATLGVNIITLDVAAIFDSIIADPGFFGLSNVEDACFIDALTVCADPDSYLFWDGVHPTAYVHELLAGFAIKALDITPVPVPAALPLLMSALGLFGFMRRRRQ